MIVIGTKFHILLRRRSGPGRRRFPWEAAYLAPPEDVQRRIAGGPQERGRLEPPGVGEAPRAVRLRSAGPRPRSGSKTYGKFSHVPAPGDHVTICAYEDCTTVVDLHYDDHEVLPNREVACLDSKHWTPEALLSGQSMTR